MTNKHRTRSLLVRSAQSIIQAVDPETPREGTEDTPKRFAKAWEHYTSGYGFSPAEVMKVFEDGAPARNDQMVTMTDIPFYSHCEHHLAPFFGTVAISYIPNGKVVGLSKLIRVVNIFARRLQVQERLTEEIADTLSDGLDALGVGVMIRARHMCIESRGVAVQGTETKTTTVRGAIMTNQTARDEFLHAVKA